MCGLFDEAEYPAGDSTGEYNNPTSFYGKTCAATEAWRNPNGGPFGLIHSAGVGVGIACIAGDGSHPDFEVQLRYENGEATAIRVLFGVRLRDE